jgi:5-methylcytosine-specific restriction endonuclease McrA
MEAKICTVCGKELPATTEYFVKQSKGRFELTASCRQCRKEIAKKNREKNPNYMKEYYKKNKEKLLEQQKQYYEKHREEYLSRFNEYGKKYYADNIEKIKKYREKWVRENPNYFKEYHKKCKPAKLKYYSENRERILKVKKVWRSKDEVKQRESQRQRERYKDEKHRTIRLLLNQKRRSLAGEKSLTVDEWEALKVEFNNCCAYCGRKEKLTQDHIMPISKGGTYSKGNIVPACGKCNSSKNNKGLEDWYKGQDFFNNERLQSILKIYQEV